jgi:putative ABC transport system substrate-binding protein
MWKIYKLNLSKEVYILFHIGILQLTQNLDDAVRGFKQGLQNLGIQAKFTYLNADGKVEILPELAQKLVDSGVDLIFSCSTPAAKAAQRVTGEIPILFTPVFDPVSVKLVDSMQSPGANITGMSGMVQAQDKITLIQELLPTAKKIGVLYHTADDNTLIETNNFCAAAANLLTIQKIAIQTAADISLLEEKLAADIDALFLPIGRIVEENFSSIAYYADMMEIPIIASHGPNVVMGALGALIANHAALGIECANQAKSILVDKKLIHDIPVGITKMPEILLNSFVADNLGIELSAELQKKAKEIYA